MSGPADLVLAGKLLASLERIAKASERSAAALERLAKVIGTPGPDVDLVADTRKR